MAAQFLSSYSALLHQQLLLPSTSDHLRYVSSSVSATAKSRFQTSKQRSIGTDSRNLSFGWMTATGANVQSAAVPTSVPVRVAHELLQAGHRYLDVRTPEEFSAGHAVGATNIPYLCRVGSAMIKNDNFLAQVLSHFRKDDEIIIGCKSGKRSLMAATDLILAGFTGVTDIAGGYDAWHQNGLPTETKD